MLLKTCWSLVSAEKRERAGGKRKDRPDIPEEIGAKWESILSDEGPCCFMLAVYSSNGKALELVASGPEEGPDGLGKCGWVAPISRPDPGLVSITSRYVHGFRSRA